MILEWEKWALIILFKKYIYTSVRDLWEFYAELVRTAHHGIWQPQKSWDINSEFRILRAQVRIIGDIIQGSKSK